jgi:Mn2+/Fe2+ NRAMP family transporter
MNGVLLPFILVAMLRLVSRTDLMGELVSGPVYNVVVWVTIVALIALTAVMIVTAFLA